MLGICNKYDDRAWVRDQWQCVLSHFFVSSFWTRGVSDDAEQEKIPHINIENAAELPDYPIVVCSHPDARYIQGTKSLVDFVHPENAIYLFGADNFNLNNEEDLGGRVPDHKIFVPSGRYEMYSFIAGSIVLYDRLTKAKING